MPIHPHNVGAAIFLGGIALLLFVVAHDRDDGWYNVAQDGLGVLIAAFAVLILFIA